MNSITLRKRTIEYLRFANTPSLQPVYHETEARFFTKFHRSHRHLIEIVTEDESKESDPYFRVRLTTAGKNYLQELEK